MNCSSTEEDFTSSLASLTRNATFETLGNPRKKTSVLALLPP
jgi:hypothetical protein